MRWSDSGAEEKRQLEQRNTTGTSEQVEAEVERLTAELKATEGSLASIKSSAETYRQRNIEALEVCCVALRS